jgi:hypothetical protein
VRLTDGEAQLVRWLPPNAMVISTNPQILASISEARFHWIHCDASGETTTAMLRAFPIDYVLMYEHETRCRFVNEAGPMRLVAAFGEPGRRVFVLQPLNRPRRAASGVRKRQFALSMGQRQVPRLPGLKGVPLTRCFAPPSPRKRGEGRRVVALLPARGETVPEGRMRGCEGTRFVSLKPERELALSHSRHCAWASFPKAG